MMLLRDKVHQPKKLRPDVAVSPKQFKAAADNVFEMYDGHLRYYWRSSKKFTNLVWGAKSSKTQGRMLYRAIADELGLCMQQEYWDVDAVYYRKACDLANASARERASILSVALEHENGYDGSCTDMNRLLYCTALLKVLVTYPERRKYYPASKFYEKDVLSSYAKQIKIVDANLPNFSRRQKIIALFGYRQRYKPMVWRYHLYDSLWGKFYLMD